MAGPQIAQRNLGSECTFTGTRSSGPGGQNVNKVNTRIELRFNVSRSSKLTDEEKQLILSRLVKKISRDGDLVVVSQSERSQLANKKKAVEKFHSLLEKALEVRTKRIGTSPTRTSRIERMHSKQIRSSVKKLRGRVDETKE